MSALREGQRVFWQAVRTGPDADGVETTFAGSEAFPARERLVVYQTAYWVRQVSALRELFPSVVKAVGDDVFAREASRFIAAAPSRHWALEQLGEGFPAALARQLGPVEGRLAGIDWNRWAAFVAEDEALLEALEPATLQGTRIQLARHVRWTEVEPRSAALGAPLHDVSGPGLLCVWREGVDLRECLVDLAHLPLLEASRAGVDLPAWCEQYAQLAPSRAPDDLARDLLATLQRWVQRRWLRAG